MIGNHFGPGPGAEVGPGARPPKPHNTHNLGDIVNKPREDGEKHEGRFENAGGFKRADAPKPGATPAAPQDFGSTHPGPPKPGQKGPGKGPKPGFR